MTRLPRRLSRAERAALLTILATGRYGESPAADRLARRRLIKQIGQDTVIVEARRWASATRAGLYVLTARGNHVAAQLLIALAARTRLQHAA